MSEEIKSRVFNYGDKNESDVISKYGTGERGLKLKYCKATGTVLPVDEARKLDAVSEADSNRTLANIAHGYIPDEMDETKHPMNGKHYTSKSKFREVTKAFGLVEIGTAYQNGYDPEKDSDSDKARRERQGNEKFKEKLIWNLQRHRN